MALIPPTPFTTRTGKSLMIRPCELSDVDAFLEFQPLIAAETQFTMQVAGAVPERANIERAWKHSLEDPLALRISAFDHNRMVAQLMFYPDRNPPHAWTRHVGSFGMFILREYWGEGLGQRLLSTMENHAKEAGFTRIEATVRTNNERGVRLYSKAGYQIEGTRKNAALIDGKYQDEFFIAKLF